jgi:hypothetical protein
VTAFTASAAFVAGLAASPHCAGMCGPLVGATRAGPCSYHGGRLVSYTALGALAGWIGEPLVSALASTPARIAAWMLALVLLLVGLGLERRLPQPRWAARFLLRVRLRQRLGLFTPLLPCGPLWLMLTTAGTSGGAVSGAMLMGAFALGTIPIFLGIQHGLLRLGSRFTPRALLYLQRSTALTACALLVWRATLPDAHACCH